MYIYIYIYIDNFITYNVCKHYIYIKFLSLDIEFQILKVIWIIIEPRTLIVIESVVKLKEKKNQKYE